jgi:hypothetical protein
MLLIKKRRCCMRLKTIFILTLAVSWILIGLAFCEDEVNTVVPAEEAQPAPEIQWVWGEVVSVDTNSNQLNIKYLDYETDIEKEMVIGVSDKTIFENVKSLEEIKPQDTVSIDYAVASDGKNIARNISVEKPESIGESQQEKPAENQELKKENAVEGVQPEQASSEDNTQSQY